MNNGLHHSICVNWISTKLQIFMALISFELWQSFQKSNASFNLNDGFDQNMLHMPEETKE